MDTLKKFSLLLFRLIKIFWPAAPMIITLNYGSQDLASKPKPSKGIPHQSSPSNF